MATTWLYVPANICDIASKKGDAHDATSMKGQVSSVLLTLETTAVFDSDEPAIEIPNRRVVSCDLQPVFVESSPIIVVRAKVVVSHDCTLSFGDHLAL